MGTMNKTIFPYITGIDEFRANVLHREEIREADISDHSKSFCYMISSEGTFDTPWLRECRGIVFSKNTGQVTGRPLHKFFNVGEREETRFENLDWTQIKRIMVKRDGSMIHTVFDNGALRLKSKKTFGSDVAAAAEKWMSERDNYVYFATRMAALNMTAIFEWTAPDARIVLFYPEPKLTLLHVRHNVTGEYLAPDVMFEWAFESDVAVVEELKLHEWLDVADERVARQLSSKDIQARALKLVETAEDIEGWVIQFNDDTMVKLKVDWYLKRHRAMTFIRERDIAQLVLDEGLDDMKALLVSENVDITEILQIEQRVVNELNELRRGLVAIVDVDRGLERKDFALKHKGHQHFGLLMSIYLGKEPDLKSYFERNLLREHYTLRQLVLVPSVAEAD